MLAQRLRAIVDIAAPQLRALSTAELDHRPGPDRWSKKEIIGHLIDSAYNNHQRFLRAPAQAHLRFRGYAQDEWVRRNAYQEREAAEVIATFLCVQRHLAHAIATLPDAVLNRESAEHEFHLMAMRAFPEGQPASLGLLIEDYLFHLVHHLRQVLPDFTADWYVGYQRSAAKLRLE